MDKICIQFCFADYLKKIGVLSHTKTLVLLQVQISFYYGKKEQCSYHFFEIYGRQGIALDGPSQL